MTKCPFQRKATVEQNNLSLVTVSFHTYWEYVTFYIGSMHDCYILAYKSTEWKIVSLEFFQYQPIETPNYKTTQMG